MTENISASRREFLAGSAKVAAVAGLLKTAGVYAADDSPKYEAVAGPAPKPIGPDGTIRLGLIGVGNRGKKLLNSTLKDKNVRFMAVADLDKATCEAVRGLINKTNGQSPDIYVGPDAYRDSILSRDDIDAVVLATPPCFHARMYLDTFAAGKHFYGEKPMCLEVREADALIEAQKKNPRIICQIGYQRRAMKKYQEAIRKIREGILGKPISGKGAFNPAYAQVGYSIKGYAPWYGRRKMSGDWMLEQACHSWDVYNWVADAVPLAAMGVGRNDIYKHLDPERDVTDFYKAILEYPEGLVVNWEHNWIYPKNDEGRFSGVYERVAGLKAGIDLGEGKIFPTDPKEKMVQLPSDAVEPNDRSIGEFLDSVRTGAKPVSGVVNGRMATLTGLLVRKAVYENRRVEMKEII